MFYCRYCQRKNNWPESVMTSWGPCEVCGRITSCFDVPASMLPLANQDVEMPEIYADLYKAVAVFLDNLSKGAAGDDDVIRLKKIVRKIEETWRNQMENENV